MQLLSLVRTSLGRIIQGLDWITRRSPMKRSDAEQAIIQSEAKKLTLYQHNLCPFCIKTRRALHQLNVSVEIRDIKKDPQYRDELQSGGGKIQVPCLRIEEAEGFRWMYESNDINHYLQGRFGQ